MKSKTLSLKTITNELDFLKKINYNSMKRLSKKNLLLLANKLTKNMPDPRNAEEQYQSFIIKKTQKISKTIRNNYLCTKNFPKPKHC